MFKIDAILLHVSNVFRKTFSLSVDGFSCLNSSGSREDSYTRTDLANFDEEHAGNHASYPA